MRAAAILLALILAAPARAQDACAQFAWPIGREKNLFARADLPQRRSGETLKLPDAAARILLRPVADVQWTRNPERALKNPDSYGGVVEIDGVKPGLYQLTLSDEAWIDVIQNDGFVKSVAHSGKKDCAGVRKSVRFELGAGPVIVQLSGASSDTIDFAIVAVE